jgi:hypothetical protein
VAVLGHADASGLAEARTCASDENGFRHAIFLSEMFVGGLTKKISELL